VVIGLLHHLHLAGLNQRFELVQNLRLVFAALLQEDSREAVCDLERPLFFLMLEDALKDALISRQIAFLGYPIKDPAILGSIEVEVR